MRKYVCGKRVCVKLRADQSKLVEGDVNRDVPDIRFRFLLAGYPAVFFYPAPVPAEMVPGTGYLYRIVLGRFRQLVTSTSCRAMQCV